MLAKKVITESLQKTVCPRCKASLENAHLVTVSEAPSSLVAHTVCPVCKAESMLTITSHGSGILPVQSDLTAKEFKTFMLSKTVSYDDLLDLHSALKKDSLWKLLEKREKSLRRKQKA